MVKSDIEIEVSFSLLSESIKLRMKANGVVIRWEPENGMYYGFAVLNSRYSVHSDGDP